MMSDHFVRLCAALAAPLAAAVLTAAFPPLAQAAHPTWKVVFDRAEFVLSNAARPPDDTAGWKPVALPDEWRRTSPGISGQGWYRIRFDLEQAPRRMHAVFVEYRRSHQLDYFINGELVGSSRHVTATNTAGSLPGITVYVTIPPHLLHAGKNVLHVRMQATAAVAAIHGLGQVTFGEAREVRKGYIARIEHEAEALRSSFAVALASGLIALCLWLARRVDRVMLLLAITCLSWAFATSWQRPLRWVELPPAISGIPPVFLSYGLPAMAVVLCLRAAGLSWPIFERGLWAYLAVIVTLPLWGTGTGEEWRLVLDAVNTALLLACAAIIAFHAKQRLRWSVSLHIATLLVMAALTSSEFLRYFGWINPDSLIVRHFHVLVMIVGIGSAIFADHVLAVWRAEETNTELERRFADKTREIEANHARLEESIRELALARERQRIVTDMHDGLGASLVALLGHVQAGNLGPGSIEQRVREAMQELRIAVEALQPSESDIASVLGNLRGRLEEMIQAPGVKLEWAVDESPLIDRLQPTTVFALQRIILEAVTNVLKHSNASTVRLTAREHGSDSIEIRISDDGRGIGSAERGFGIGIVNMRTRAKAIGALLDITSASGQGTEVKITLPREAKLSTGADLSIDGTRATA